jgi:hypothetical protein
VTLLSEGAARELDANQAAELTLLIDLEARWENMRTYPPGDAATALGLQDRQRAYQAFRAKLVAYNRRYTPAYVPELLLNHPVRLSAWCRAVRDTYLLAEHHPRAHCPAHLVEKARRWAGRVGARSGQGFAGPAGPPASIGAAILDLEELIGWCDRVSAGPVSCGIPEPVDRGECPSGAGQDLKGARV